MTETKIPELLKSAQKRKASHKYCSSNTVADSIGIPIGLLVPTNWSFGRLLKEAYYAWAHLISDSEKKKFIRNIFEIYDTNNNGYIDYVDFSSLLLNIKEVKSFNEINYAIEEIDEDGNAIIEFEIFYTWLVSDINNEKHADLINRLINTCFGYRDTNIVESFSNLSNFVKTSQKPSIIRSVQIKREKIQFDDEHDDEKDDEHDSNQEASASSERSFEEIQIPSIKNNPQIRTESESNLQPHKKKGKRKSRKPEKLEDSDEYETSDDDKNKAVDSSKRHSEGHKSSSKTKN